MTAPPSGSHPERLFERLEIDGVPAFAGQGSRYMGALLFRAGRGDETLHIGGVTHLVEHLGANQYRIASPPREWVIAAAAVHLHREIAAQFYRAIPPPGCCGPRPRAVPPAPATS